MMAMRGETHHIPTRDLLGQKVKIGDQAILFSKEGIHYEGIIQQIGGKRWFVVDETIRIGGIGNHYFIKDDPIRKEANKKCCT